MAKPCMECGARPKWGGRHRCIVCAVRHMPVDEQVEHARRRLAMVPPELRVKRVPAYLWPPGSRWCASCQSFRDLVDFGKGSSQCRACVSAKTHAARIEKVYGLDREGYDALLKAQGGRCAICRARPKSKRLAVDHDHKTGAVRGLLCSRCNHDLMGAAWDSLSVAEALITYLKTPPALGNWVAPEEMGQTGARLDAPGLMAPGGTTGPSRPPNASTGRVAPQPSGPTLDTLIAAGAESVPGKRGVWRIYVEPDGDPPF